MEARLLLEEGWDGVLSVTPYRQDPRWAVGLLGPDGEVRRAPIAAWGREPLPPEQVGPLWKADGTALWVRTEAFLAKAKPPDWFYALRLRAYRMDRMESVDVDHEDDLVRAEALLQRREAP